MRQDLNYVNPFLPHLLWLCAGVFETVFFLRVCVCPKRMRVRLCMNISAVSYDAPLM